MKSLVVTVAYQRNRGRDKIDRLCVLASEIITFERHVWCACSLIRLVDIDEYTGKVVHDKNHKCTSSNPRVEVLKENASMGEVVRCDISDPSQGLVDIADVEYS